MNVVTFEQIVAAAHRIRGSVRFTPCQLSARLETLLGSPVYLKMENMQHTGAYKERGALNKLKSLTHNEKHAGVYAASAGNHAQGLAYHAGKLGIKSTIFMPIGTPTIKVSRTLIYGAEVKIVGRNFDEAFEACMESVNLNKGTLVHPFDDRLVIAGQGTIGLEILNQQPDIDILVIPVGGGGMISGIARAAKEINPNIKIIGVEPAKIPSMAKAVAGDRSIQPAVMTIAEGINVRKVGDLTYEICKELVDEWVTVTDEEICRAILFLLEGEKTVSEGAGAAGVAALMAGKIDVAGKKVATVICGGNIDVNALALIIESGLIDSGRRVKLSATLPDKPGSLSQLMNLISSQNANVVCVNHERTQIASFGKAKVQMTLDVRDFAHANDIVQLLREVYKEDSIVQLD